MFAVLAVMVAAYTNHAGNVIAGAPVALSRTDVVLQAANGRRDSYALSVFPTNEQRRICADFGQPLLPPSVAAAERGFQKMYRRALRRAEKGLVAKDAAEDSAARFGAAFRNYLESSEKGGLISARERAAVLKRNGL